MLVLFAQCELSEGEGETRAGRSATFTPIFESPRNGNHALT